MTVRTSPVPVCPAASAFAFSEKRPASPRPRARKASGGRGAWTATSGRTARASQQRERRDGDLAAVTVGPLEILDRMLNARDGEVNNGLPNVEPFVLPAATHMLHLQNPRGMAEALAGFLSRHPLEAATSRA